MPALDVLNEAVMLFETGIESGSTHMSKNMVGRSLRCVTGSHADSCVPPQEAVRNMHRETHEAVGNAQRSSNHLHTPLHSDELDRLTGMARASWRLLSTCPN